MESWYEMKLTAERKMRNKANMIKDAGQEMGMCQVGLDGSGKERRKTK